MKVEQQRVVGGGLGGGHSQVRVVEIESNEEVAVGTIVPQGTVVSSETPVSRWQEVTVRDGSSS